MLGSRHFGSVVEHCTLTWQPEFKFIMGVFQPNLLCFVLCYGFHVIRQWTLVPLMAFAPKYYDSKLIFYYEEYIFLTINPFYAYGNYIIKNFAVVMSIVVKRADCNLLATLYIENYFP